MEFTIAFKLDNGDVVDQMVSVGDVVTPKTYLYYYYARLTNEDEQMLDVKSQYENLLFESRFESGNLRKAIKVS